jgi:transposase
LDTCSCRRIPAPTYYTRQQIVQIFDIGKNYTTMLPLRVHTEETFRGHLLLTFIASVIVKMIQDDLKDTAFNPTSAFLQLKNQQCKVFDNDIIPQEAVKKVNDIYKKFTFKSPKTILRNKALHV